MKTTARSGALLFALFALAACSSKGSTAGRTCVDDSVCETGQVCGQNGTCENVACQTRRDCPGSSTCLPSGFCGPIQCSTNDECGDAGRICREGVCIAPDALPACGDGGTCENGKVCNRTSSRCEDCNTTTNRCAVGQTCRNGSCETTSCTSDAQCLSAGKLCDQTSRQCVACSATRVCPNTHVCQSGSCTPRPRCMNGMCPSPQTCDTATNFCINAGGASLCGRCNADAECSGTNSKCLALGGGNYCGKACTGQNDCPSNFVCDPNFRQCVPAAGRCENNCGVPGQSCTGGRACNATSGLCLTSKGLCDACSADSECGAESDKCLVPGDGGARVCAQNCDTTTPNGRNCPTGFTCRDAGGGSRQCYPTGGECVVDPCANLMCNRQSGLPFCDPDRRACVECRTNNDCPASDQICTADKTCIVPGQCTGDMSCQGDPAGPKCCTTTLGQKCSQCCNNTDCPTSAQFCVANRCQATQDPCTGVTCNPGQTCNPANGNCEGGGMGTGECTDSTQCAAGQICLNLVLISFCTCTTNADCVAPLVCNELFPGLVSGCGLPM